MARQNINLGTDPNDGEGDNLRTAFDKVNDNFIEVYAAGPAGSNIVISGNTIASNVTNANLELSPNGTGKVVFKNDLVPDANNTRYIGSATSRPRGVYVGSAGINSVGDIITTGNISANNIQYTGEVFVGDLKGSVFADDSTIIVDAIDNSISADTGVFGTSVQATSISGNSLSLNASGNLWSISDDFLSFPSGASWRSESETADEYISSAPNGYINITTSDSAANRSQIQIEHGIIQINFFNGSNVSFNFDETGNLSHPKDFLPQANNASRNLGSISEEWYNLYAGNLRSNSNIGVYSNLVPGSNVTYSLGNSTNQWSELWVSGNTVYLGGVPLSISGTTLTVNGQAVLANAGSSDVDTTGNITAGNILSDNYLYANGAPFTGGGDYGDSNVVTLLSSFGSNTVVTTGNISAGNVIATFIGDVTGNVTGSASTAATVTTAAQPNITSVGALTGITTSGNITGVDTADNTAPTSYIIRAGDNTSGDLFNSASGGALTIQGGSSLMGGGGALNLYGGNGGQDGTINIGTSHTAAINIGTEMRFGDWDGTSNKDSAVFGDGLDLRIYHDGTDSWITDNNGSGILKIATSQLSILGGNDGAETMATFVDNGAVTLYYDNNAKIATTSAGVTVTGNITAGNVLAGNVIFTDGFVVPSNFEAVADNSVLIEFNDNASNTSSFFAQFGEIYLNVLEDSASTDLRLSSSNVTISDGLGGSSELIVIGNATASNVIVSTSLTGVDSSPYPTINNFQSATFFGNITGGNLIATGNIDATVNGFDIGYLEIPQVSLSANTIAELSDSGKHYYSTTASTLTLTIPSNANVAFPTGSAITVVVQSAGDVNILTQSGVSLYLAGNSTAANRTVGSYGMATIMKVASDTWFITGSEVS